MGLDATPNGWKCFWGKCSDQKRCLLAGSCVAQSQAGGATFPARGPMLNGVEFGIPRLTQEQMYEYMREHATYGTVVLEFKEGFVRVVPHAEWKKMHEEKAGG